MVSGLMSEESTISDSRNQKVTHASVHGGKKPFICLIYHMAAFHEHVKVVHEWKKPFKCENCDDKLAWKLCQRSWFQCKVCNKWFTYTAPD